MSTDCPAPSYVHELGRPNTADALRQVQTERAAVTESPTAAKKSSTAAEILYVIGTVLFLIGALVLFPATSLFVGILGAVLMLIGGNALIGGAVITGLRR